jgi:hypothetical protein
VRKFGFGVTSQGHYEERERKREKEKEKKKEREAKKVVLNGRFPIDSEFTFAQQQQR